jgi:hypothetical protein
MLLMKFAIFVHVVYDGLKIFYKKIYLCSSVHHPPRIRLCIDSRMILDYLYKLHFDDN